MLASDAAARDFIADPFAHAKFIAYADTAKPLLDKAGVHLDGGCLRSNSANDANGFLAQCVAMRFWDREATVHAI